MHASYGGRCACMHPTGVNCAHASCSYCTQLLALLKRPSGLVHMCLCVCVCVAAGQKQGGQVLVGGLDIKVSRNFFGAQASVLECTGRGAMAGTGQGGVRGWAGGGQ